MVKVVSLIESLQNDIMETKRCLAGKTYNRFVVSLGGSAWMKVLNDSTGEINMTAQAWETRTYSYVQAKHIADQFNMHYEGRCLVQRWEDALSSDLKTLQDVVKMYEGLDDKSRAILENAA